MRNGSRRTGTNYILHVCTDFLYELWSCILSPSRGRQISLHLDPRLRPLRSPRLHPRPPVMWPRWGVLMQQSLPGLMITAWHLTKSGQNCLMYLIKITNFRPILMYWLFSHFSIIPALLHTYTCIMPSSSGYCIHVHVRMYIYIQL